jgi:hypothetical protein
MNGMLLGLVAVATCFGAPAKSWTEYLRHPLALSHSVKGAAQKHGLQKRCAGSAGTVWKQVGTSHYSNLATWGSPAQWKLYSRDTVVYDGDGNEILAKTSMAGSGWETDSLESLDSLVYSGGQIVLQVSFAYDNYGGTAQNTGGRATYAWSNGGRTDVETYSNWDDANKSWALNGRDSIVFFCPPGTLAVGNFVNIQCLSEAYSFTLDSVSSTWESNGSMVRIDSESNATTFTTEEKELMPVLGSGQDSLFDTKYIYSFKSPVWSENALTQVIILEKNPVSGAFDSAGKDVFTYNANGFGTGEWVFDWDTTSKSFVCMDKEVEWPDSHGNDTLTYTCTYATPTSSWDTSMQYSYALTYDANGNNTVSVESFFEPAYGNWVVSNMDVNTFAQVNSGVIRPVKSLSGRMPSVVSTAGRITFLAPDITAVALYNASGRIVRSVKQESGTSISLAIAGATAPLSTGVYVAILHHGNEQTSIRVPICR